MPALGLALGLDFGRVVGGSAGAGGGTDLVLTTQAGATMQMQDGSEIELQG
jgi:hypothetical protein